MTSFAFILGCVPCGSRPALVGGPADYGTASSAACWPERDRDFSYPAIFYLVEKWSGAGKELALRTAAAPAAEEREIEMATVMDDRDEQRSWS